MTYKLIIKTNKRKREIEEISIPKWLTSKGLVSVPRHRDLSVGIYRNEIEVIRLSCADLSHLSTAQQSIELIKDRLGVT